MAKQFEHKAVEVEEQGKPVEALLAAEGSEGWRLLQAWTTSKGKDYLLFRRPKKPHGLKGVV
jgi:hypothetical protein